MNIAEIAFSIDWFLTIPGMLITGGVLLLIIALIMMIVSSSKKGKKKEEATAGVEQNASAAPVASDSTAGMTTMAPATESVAMDAPLGPITDDVVGEAPYAIPDAASTVGSGVAVVPPMNAPTMQTPPNPDTVTPLPEVNSIPSVVPIEPTQVTSTSENVIPTESIIPTVVEEPVLETPDATNLEKTSVNIYGGNPIPPIEPIVNEPRPIYGGANPLEATQNLPKVDVHHQPYSGGKEEVPTPSMIPPVEEASTVTPAAPEEKPVIPIPDIQPVESVEPAVIVPPIVEETPVSPAAPAESPVNVIEPQAEDAKKAADVVQIPDIEQL